jgi:hypothetical protein
VKLGAFSLDVEVNAYLFARDWVHFLTLQEGLLFGVTDIVARAGTEIAFPSQTMYVSAASSETPHPSPLPASGARGPETPLPFEGRGQGGGSGSEGATVAGEARSFLRARGAD